MSSNRVLAPLHSPAPSTRRRGLRTVAVGAAVVLGLAACGDADEASGGDAALDPISVDGAFGEAPAVEFEEPFELEESVSEVLEEGDGEEVAAGDTVTIDYSIYSGTEGTELDTSFGGTSVSLPLAEGQTTPALIDALVGQNVGARVLAAVAPEPVEEGATPNPAGEDTLVFVMDVVEIVPSRADGEPVDQPEGTPVVETDDEGDVTSLVVEGVEPPEELEVTTVLEGDGTEVQAGDSVTIHYTGVLSSDGTQFDSSWERGTPTTFPLSNLIPGWQQGLAGVPVGSRVILQVPPELGYGEAGSPPTIPANADLTFVIDVLATQPAPEAPAPAPSE